MPARPIVVKPTKAAELLDCSRAHVYQLMERGVLPRIRIPGSNAVRIPVADIYRLVGLEPHGEHAADADDAK